MPKIQDRLYFALAYDRATMENGMLVMKYTMRKFGKRMREIFYLNMSDVGYQKTKEEDRKRS